MSTERPAVGVRVTFQLNGVEHVGTVWEHRGTDTSVEYLNAESGRLSIATGPAGAFTPLADRRPS